MLAESLQQTGNLDRAVAVLEALADRCTREEAWLTFAQASCALSIMYIESGDTGRAADSAEVAVTAVEAAGLTGTEEHLRLCSVLMFALVERGDLMYASLSCRGAHRGRRVHRKLRRPWRGLLERRQRRPRAWPRH